LFRLPELKQNSKTKADKNSVRRFFAKPMLNAFRVFAFLAQKNLWQTFSGKNAKCRLTPAAWRITGI